MVLVLVTEVVLSAIVSASASASVMGDGGEDAYAEGLLCCVV
jgi:hypothetical protein